MVYGARYRLLIIISLNRKLAVLFKNFYDLVCVMYDETVMLDNITITGFTIKRTQRVGQE